VGEHAQRTQQLGERHHLFWRGGEIEKTGFFSMVLAIAAMTAQATHGAEITVRTDAPVVTIDGDILPNENDVFASKVSALSGTYVVALQSRGGNPIAAMEIGKFIRMRGWMTYVASGCHSACALIWLAGVKMATPGPP
jgi:hypothetical protein